jgi:hypothetical protein
MVLMKASPDMLLDLSALRMNTVSVADYVNSLEESFREKFLCANKRIS